MWSEQLQNPGAKKPGDKIEKFIKDLDDLNKTAGRGNNKEKTRDLLEVGDRLFEADQKLQGLIKQNALQKAISGDSYIEEKFGNEKFNRPVIDLVQQGGTMLGIGLLGYTYIMEKAGVRFRSMAGTSAGAINTLLLAALPEEIYQNKSYCFDDGRQATKSEFLAYLVANKNFIDFLDRKGFIGRVQRFLVNRITMLEKLRWVFAILFPLSILGLSLLIYMGINGSLFTMANGLTENEVRIYDFVTGTLGITALVLFIVVVFLRLFKKNMGLNMGHNVYQWMKGILETDFVNIHTTADLELRKQTETKVTNNKRPEPFGDPRLVFIAANLTHNRIVKFPENASDYWKPAYAKQVTPAAYVRASMSLPFIFYAFIPYDIHVQTSSGLKPAAMSAEPPGNAKKYNDTIDTLARFVDGGMLSNFPIREFHVPPHTEPRYPTFGVLLSAFYTKPPADSQTEKDNFFKLSVIKFILSFISTFRRFYDRDFLVAHPEFKQLVKSVDTKAFNSLDFGMSAEKKKELFAEGAKTAISQLTEFKWDGYLAERNKKK